MKNTFTSKPDKGSIYVDFSINTNLQRFVPMLVTKTIIQQGKPANDASRVQQDLSNILFALRCPRRGVSIVDKVEFNGKDRAVINLTPTFGGMR